MPQTLKASPPAARCVRCPKPATLRRRDFSLLYPGSEEPDICEICAVGQCVGAAEEHMTRFRAALEDPRCHPHLASLADAVRNWLLNAADAAAGRVPQ